MAAAGGDAAARAELLTAKNAYKELVGRNPPNKPKAEKAAGADGAAAAGGMSKRYATSTLLGPPLPYSCYCRTRHARQMHYHSLSAPARGCRTQTYHSTHTSHTHARALAHCGAIAISELSVKWHEREG